jgi:hypothetical protein
MPPRLALLGVVGGPLIFVSSIAVLFGAYEQDGLHALLSIPEGAFEAAFAIYRERCAGCAVDHEPASPGVGEAADHSGETVAARAG